MPARAESAERKDWPEGRMRKNLSHVSEVEAEVAVALRSGSRHRRLRKLPEMEGLYQSHSLDIALAPSRHGFSSHKWCKRTCGRERDPAYWSSW